MDTIRDKIRKLLALAGNNPNEHEAARAMELASRLMMEHGIEQASISMVDGKPVIKESSFFDFDKWRYVVARGCGYLYGCQPVGYKAKGQAPIGFRFVGREDNINAAQDTWEHICTQIEALYKSHLPRGMSKGARAEFRRDFKHHCALAVGSRCMSIAKSQQQSRALVVHRGTLMEEIDQFLGETMKMKSRALVRPISAGMLMEVAAAEKVRIHREVKR